MSASMYQAAPAQSFVVPDMFSTPGLTNIYQSPQTMTYAAPQMTTMTGGSIAYMQPAGGSVTYAAPEQVGGMVYAAPGMSYAAAGGSGAYAAAEPVGGMLYGNSTMTYAAPAMSYAAAESVGSMVYGAPAMTYAAPAAPYASMPGQPAYTITPERFQLILQGVPLSPEEIASMTGQGAAPMATSAAVPIGMQTATSFVMPDMFSSPGLTNVYHGSAPAAPVSTMNPGVSAIVDVGAATVPAVAPAAVSATSSKKKSSKKDSKKKVSSKKKAKGGCC